MSVFWDYKTLTTYSFGQLVDELNSSLVPRVARAQGHLLSRVAQLFRVIQKFTRGVLKFLNQIRRF